MRGEHPSFPNPTIHEALCEIHFALPGHASWDASLFGKFFQSLQPEFPQLEPITLASLEVQLISGKVGLLPPQSRMRYRHAERNVLLQLSEGILTVNILPRYEGWPAMLSDILDAWQRSGPVLRPEGIRRIGLRYINFVPRQSPTERPGDWLASNDYVAAAALHSQPGFLCRTEVHEGQAARSIVTLAEAVDAGASHFVLDIDCIQEQGGNGFLELVPVLDGLHDAVWTIFQGFVSPRLRDLLEGGEP